MKNRDYLTDEQGRLHKRFYDEELNEIIKHDEDNGCLVILQRKELKTPSTQGSVGHLLKHFVCLTHNVEVCKCGIPYGRHLEYVNLKEYEKSIIPVSNGEQVSEELSYFNEYTEGLSKW